MASPEPTANKAIAHMALAAKMTPKFRTFEGVEPTAYNVNVFSGISRFLGPQMENLASLTIAELPGSYGGAWRGVILPGVGRGCA